MKTQHYNEETYKAKISTFKTLGHSIVYKTCIHCHKGNFFHLYYEDIDKVYRTCDHCLIIERI